MHKWSSCIPSIGQWTSGWGMSITSFDSPSTKRVIFTSLLGSVSPCCRTTWTQGSFASAVSFTTNLYRDEWSFATAAVALCVPHISGSVLLQLSIRSSSNWKRLNPCSHVWNGPKNWGKSIPSPLTPLNLWTKLATALAFQSNNNWAGT